MTTTDADRERALKIVMTWDPYKRVIAEEHLEALIAEALAATRAEALEQAAKLCDSWADNYTRAMHECRDANEPTRATDAKIKAAIIIFLATQIRALIANLAETEK